MKNLKKGFASAMLIALLAMLIFVGGIYLQTNKSESVNGKTAAKIENSNESLKNNKNNLVVNSNWNTYVNSKNNYSIRYPSSYIISGSDDVLNITLKGSEKKSIQIQSRKVKEGTTLSAFTPKINELTGTPNTITQVTVNNYAALKTNAIGDGVYYIINKDNGYVIMVFTASPVNMPANKEELANVDEILNSFTILSSNSTTGTSEGTCKNGATNYPHCNVGTEDLSTGPIIRDISPLSGPKGTIVVLNGSNLSGFEGDLDATFERSDGKKFLLTDTFGDYSKTAGKFIKVVVKEPCQKGETVYGAYSGNPSICDYAEMTPGDYKVYTEPWGKKSNVVKFTITK